MFRLIGAFVLIEPCGIATVNMAGTLGGALDDVPGTLGETLDGGGLGGGWGDEKHYKMLGVTG